MQEPGYVQYPRYRQADISISLIGDAWEYIKNNMGVYVGFTAIVLIGGGILTTMIQGPGAFTPNPDNPYEMYSKPSYYLAQIAQMFVSYIFLAGITNITLKELGGTKADLGDGFAVFKNGFWHIVLAGLLAGLAVLLGTVLCIVPGIIAAVLFCVIAPAIIDQKLSAVDALAWSAKNVKPHFWPCLGLIIVGGLVSTLGFCLCCVGVFFTYSIYPIMLTMVYHQLRWEETGGLGYVEGAGYVSDPPSSPSEFSVPSVVEPPATSYPETSTTASDSVDPGSAPAGLEWPSETNQASDSGSDLPGSSDSESSSSDKPRD